MLPGMVDLWSVSTGERFTRWPVDARLMLERGGYTTVPPDTDPHAVPVSATPEQPASLKNGDIGPTGAPVVVGAAVGVRTFGDSVVGTELPAVPAKAKRR